MTRAIDYWVWPLSMPDRFMSAKVHKACHALALEDERDAFRPVIWDERYVRVTDKIAGQAKENWLVGINHDPRSDAAKKEDPHHICGSICRPLTSGASARCGSRAFIPTSAAGIRRMDSPM